MLVLALDWVPAGRSHHTQTRRRPLPGTPAIFTSQSLELLGSSYLFFLLVYLFLSLAVRNYLFLERKIISDLFIRFYMYI